MLINHGYSALFLFIFFDPKNEIQRNSLIFQFSLKYSINTLNILFLFNPKGCIFYGIIGGLFGFISITTLSLMTIERYIIVRNPFSFIRFGKKFRIGNF